MNNRCLGVLALCLAAFLAWHTRELQAPFTYEPLGPRAFPLLLIALISLCGLRLCIQAGGQTDANPKGANLRIGLLLAIIIAYALVFQTLGFPVATLLMLMLAGRLFGGRWRQLLLSGIGVSIGLYIVFDRALDIVLPLGVLERWL